MKLNEQVLRTASDEHSIDLADNEAAWPVIGSTMTADELAAISMKPAEDARVPLRPLNLAKSGGAIQSPLTSLGAAGHYEMTSATTWWQR
jgi:hypothetical protein